MDVTNLSSNWKKLQATLSAGKPREHAKENVNGSNGTSKSLKRKAAPSNIKEKRNGVHGGPPPKRHKTSNNDNHTTSTAPAHMGAYVSSLPGVSYGIPKFHQSSEPVHDAQKLSSQEETKHSRESKTQNADRSAQAGKYIGLDCEMVGTHSLTPFSILAHNNRYQPTTSTAPPEYSILARVSLVSYSLETIYDAYVFPPSGVRICDYRTHYSGITPWHLNPPNTTTNPKSFEVVQREVAALLAGRILVGHALKNDLEILGLSHPRRDIRDTARYPPFRARAAVVGKDGKPGKGKTPSLKKLAAEVLGWSIQADERKGHSSAEDAGAAMALFKMEKSGFEREAIKAFGRAAVIKNRLNTGAVGADNARAVHSKSQITSTVELGPPSERDGSDDLGLEGAPDDDDESERRAVSRQKTIMKRKSKRTRITKPA